MAGNSNTSLARNRYRMIGRRMAKNQKKADNAKQTPELTAQQERLEDVMRLVNAVATAKDWKCAATSKDKVNYRFASAKVERSFNLYQEAVTATLDITVDDVVRVSANKTSFYKHGLDDLMEAIQAEIKRLPWIMPRKPAPAQVQHSTLEQLVFLLRRFHLIARQLKQRHDGRSTIVVADEYDVQDILHALLRGMYDDVRAEEYTPSYAGGSSRIDFVLKKEKCLIEAKMASERLRDRLVGEQLILDIKKYQVHPDCQTLICFVYDPGGFIRNPSGLEADLSGTHDKLTVRVIVVSV
jgi:hypothetical protein